MATITREVELFDIVKFEQTNDHIPNGGKPFVKYMAALWFRDDSGKVYVTFVQKKTAIYQTLRVGVVGSGHKFTLSGNVKEVRQPDEHFAGERTVLTFAKIGGYKG